MKKSGLVVCSKHCFLAASPDGIVSDPTNNPPEVMLEMKYLQMKQGETLKDTVRKRVCIYHKGEIVVNPTISTTITYSNKCMSVVGYGMTLLSKGRFHLICLFRE